MSTKVQHVDLYTFLMERTGLSRDEVKRLVLVYGYSAHLSKEEKQEVVKKILAGVKHANAG